MDDYVYEIRFSGPSLSIGNQEEGEALLFLIRISGATRRSRCGGAWSGILNLPACGELASSGTTTGSPGRVQWGMHRIAHSTNWLLSGGRALPR